MDEMLCYSVVQETEIKRKGGEYLTISEFFLVKTF